MKRTLIFLSLLVGFGVGVGVLAWVGFLAYVTVFGRRAERVGDIGDLVGDEATDVLPYAA